MNEYTKQAQDFLKATKTTFKAVFIENTPHFSDDTESRDIFKVSFKRGNKSFSLKFGQSITESTGTGDNIPTEYDVLSCLQKYPLDTFDDFCSEFGYNEQPLSNYPKVKKIYNGCKKEYSNICKLWNIKEIEQLQEIN